MHSSGMRTARLLTVSQHALRRDASAQGVCVSQHAMGQDTCENNLRKTLRAVKRRMGRQGERKDRRDKGMQHPIVIIFKQP